MENRGFVALDWELAADNPRRQSSILGESDHTLDWSPRHIHAETRINEHHVHIDVLTATRGGPGRFYAECRIFVNGQLGGRGGKCGCGFGFGGGDLPAVAALGRTGALTVNIRSGRWPVAELWRTRTVREL